MLPYATSKEGSLRSNLRKKAREIAWCQARIDAEKETVPLSFERPFCSGSIRSSSKTYIYVRVYIWIYLYV